MMSVAAGGEAFIFACDRIVVKGISHSEAERNAALEGGVRTKITGTAGNKQVMEQILGVQQAGFDPSDLAVILKSDRIVKSCEVGEVYSEIYLSTHRSCTFFWSTNWDLRSRNASLPGPDLVGLQEISVNDFRFAFGEVKTSKEAAIPPSVMKGTKGLKQQVENLCCDEKQRNTLVSYLLYRCNNLEHRKKIQSAVQRYISCSSDVSVFGIMVRDVPPNPKDFRRFAEQLSRKQPPETSIEFIGIYLPPKSIELFDSYFSQDPHKANDSQPPESI